MAKRPKYSEEYKRAAVEMVLKDGLSQAEACRTLTIGSSTLSKWIKRYKEQTVEIPGDSELSRRIRALEAENRLLKMEREILKKAAAFFAKEQS